MKKCVSVLLLIFTNAMALQIGPPIPTDLFATETTQIENHLELIAQFDQLVQQLATLKNQLQDMASNSQQLASYSWTEIKTDLDTLMNISTEGEAISFREANIDKAFQDKYPGYDSSQIKNFSAAYKEWSESSMDGLKNLIKTAKQQSDDFEDETTKINTLELQNRNSDKSLVGRMQVVQLGNEFAAEQVKQMEKMRELMLSQSQAQYSYLASERSEKDTDTAQIESMLRKHMRVDPNYQHFQN